jgi:hypothetical protein
VGVDEPVVRQEGQVAAEAVLVDEAVLEEVAGTLCLCLYVLIVAIAVATLLAFFSVVSGSSGAHRFKDAE